MRKPFLYLAACMAFAAAPACAGPELDLGPVAGPDPAPATACPSEQELVKAMDSVSVSSVVRALAVPRDRDVPRPPPTSGAGPVVQLREAIGVGVDNLATLLLRERCSAGKKKIVLFLDGRPMPDLRPYPRTDPSKKLLYFQLMRTEASRDVWTYLLGKPQFQPRRVDVSVGMEDEYPVPVADKAEASIRIEIIPANWLAIWGGVVAVLFAGCIELGKRSDMLRESGVSPDGQPKAYSLGRVQLATWTFLVLTSFLFIGMITGDYTTSITSSVLALMGLSAGTAIGSSIIDSAPPSPSANPQPVPAPADAGPAADATVARARTAKPTSGRWWRDILSDGNGVNFHRFQLVAWTIVLGIIFIRQVYSQLAMPDFDTTLLGLVGISSGTYLGLKLTEA